MEFWKVSDETSSKQQSVGRGKRGGEQLETVVAVGGAAAQIVSVAHARGVDVIVLGRRGHGTITEWLSGSVSLKVIHASKIPVLTVP